MIGNALKSVYKYIGLCMIGTLACAVYTTSAYADICFLPGSDCIDNLPNGTTSKGGTWIPEPDPCEGQSCGLKPAACTIPSQPENASCTLCDNGFYKNCKCLSGFETVDGECVEKCPRNATRSKQGVCECSRGMFMCSNTNQCEPETKTGHLHLNKANCPEYICDDGYERVEGLNGCYEKCTNDQKHNPTTGKCECPSGSEVCGGKCVQSCTSGALNTDTCQCDRGPTCEAPKEYLGASNGENVCTGACGDYQLRDRVSDSYSDGYCNAKLSDGTYSDTCSQPTPSRDLVGIVRDGISVGSCDLCPLTDKYSDGYSDLTAKNRWKCQVKGHDVENFSDLCYALGFTFKTNGGVCNSPFTTISANDLYAYNSAVLALSEFVHDTSVFKGSDAVVCPYVKGYYRLDAECSDRFSDYFSDANGKMRSGNYMCYECPEDIAQKGISNPENRFFCKRRDCPEGQKDNGQGECVTETCDDKGFSVLPPIDLCSSPAACGLKSPSELLDSTSDNVSGGTQKCQASPSAIYTSKQAAKLRAAGYACEASGVCNGLYICEPAKALAAAVKTAGGTCSDCGSNPTQYKCSIGGQNVAVPEDLCNYLGYTISFSDYNNTFVNDKHAICTAMNCGVDRNQYGNLMTQYRQRFNCRCAAGYTMTSTGCVKEGNPICGYSDSISNCTEPEPNVDPEQQCYAAGYTLFEWDPLFTCGYYSTSTCSQCPYTDDPKMYMCSSGDKNETCDMGTECWCCAFGGDGCDNPEPDDCDDYSAAFDDNYSEYIATCGKSNRSRCYAEGYSDVSLDLSQAQGCEKCPYLHSGNTLYKGCYIPGASELCHSQGYNTSLGEWEYLIRRYQADCSRCPEDLLGWGKDCVNYCTESGYYTTEQSCSDGQVSKTVTIGRATCYTECKGGDTISDEISDDTDGGAAPTPAELCGQQGYRKASGEEVKNIDNGILQCNKCPLDTNYIKECIDLGEVCRGNGYTEVDTRGYIGSKVAEGYTCTQCPKSSYYWKCLPPPPPGVCDEYSTVTCDLSTQYCADSISECGCLECEAAPGEKCGKDKHCSTSTNSWGLCEGGCVCDGFACTGAEFCSGSVNSCGNCKTACSCPGTKCVGEELCAGEFNSCGNCTGSCVDRNACPKGYTRDNPGGCPDTTTTHDGDTCYGPHKDCVCPDGKSTSCGDTQKSTEEETLPDGTKCYTCVAKTCADYGYQEGTDCGDFQKAKTVPSANVGGLTCNECVDKTCSDYSQKDSCSCGASATYTHGSLTCYSCKSCSSSGGSNGGGSNGGGSNGGGSNGGGSNGGGNNDSISDCRGETGCSGVSSSYDLSCDFQYQRNCTDCDGNNVWYCDDGYSADEISEGHDCPDGYSWGGTRCVSITIEQECDSPSDCSGKISCESNEHYICSMHLCACMPNA